MFNDPTHPVLQALADHHDAGTHDQIPADQATTAVDSFHQNADPALVQEVTDQHYENMSQAQLQQAAQQFKDKIASAGGDDAEAAQLAAVDPATATPQQVAAMHRFVLKEHPELMKEILIGGAATIAVGALAAFAAKKFLASRR